MLSPFDTMCPTTFLAPTLNEPMLVVRNKQGEIQCLSNVCTHRGNILLHQASKKKIKLCAAITAGALDWTERLKACQNLLLRWTSQTL